KTPYGNPAFPPGNGNGHGRRDFGGTHSRPSGGGGPGYHVPASGASPGGRPPGGNTSYPEQWYDHPQLDDRAFGDSRPSRSVDPRLAGMTYGELRYDDPEPGEAGHHEPLDDESWFQDLRRSATAPPQAPGPQGPGSGPQRRPGPGFGPQPGHPQAPD